MIHRDVGYESTPEITAILVEKIRDDEVLSGAYVAQSGTPAYGTLKAMVAAGDAHPLGERIQIDGSRYFSAVVGMKPNVSGSVRLRVVPREGMRPNADGEAPRMVAARVSELEFDRYRREYSDWQEAWWREVIQNAVDNGATVVRCSTEQMDDGQWKVTCEDNGTGMDENILMNVFLVRGATSKTEQDLGGFGQAKKLILYTWAFWEITTRDLYVQGQNELHYEHPVKAEQRVNGTRVSVLMPNDSCTTIDRAIAFVSKCHLPRIQFYMNGERISGGKVADGELIKTLGDWGELYFAKGRKRKADFPGSMLVRVPATGGNGELFMFEEQGAVPDDIPGQIILRIVGPSKEILSVSRDNLRGYWRKIEVNQFLQQLASDKKTTLKKEKPPERIAFTGRGRMTPEVEFEVKERKRRKQAALLETSGGMVPKGKKAGAPPGEQELSTEQVEVLAEALGNFGSNSDTIDVPGMDEGTQDFLRQSVTPDMAKAMLAKITVKGPEHVENMAQVLAWEPDFYLYSQIEGWKIHKKFYPEHMPSNVRKLAMLWTEMCRFLLMALNCSREFGVGFIFDDGSGSFGGGGTKAAYLPEDPAVGGEWLFINPFDPISQKEKIRGTTSDEDLNDLWASALHEVTHMVDRISEHNEDFASALTDNVARTARYYKYVKKLKRTVLDREKEIAAKIAAAREAEGPKPKVRTVEWPGKDKVAGYVYQDSHGEYFRTPMLKKYTGRCVDRGLVTTSDALAWEINAAETTRDPSGRQWIAVNIRCYPQSWRGSGKSAHLFVTGMEPDGAFDLFFVDASKHPTYTLDERKPNNIFQQNYYSDREAYKFRIAEGGLYERLMEGGAGIELLQVPKDEAAWAIAYMTDMGTRTAGEQFQKFVDDVTNVAKESVTEEVSAETQNLGFYIESSESGARFYAKEGSPEVFFEIVGPRTVTRYVTSEKLADVSPYELVPGNDGSFAEQANVLYDRLLQQGQFLPAGFVMIEVDDLTPDQAEALIRRWESAPTLPLVPTRSLR